MEEKRIDLRIPDQAREAEVRRTAEVLFRLNQTMPFSEEYSVILKELFTGGMGEQCNITGPLYMIIAENLHIGNRVAICPYFKCMSAGHIYIDDDTQIAMGVSIITNNHDFYDRPVLTVKDVHIKKNVWIGANVTILPGVTIGENAIIGAGSVVTKDIPANTIAVGNPARPIKTLDAEKFM